MLRIIGISRTNKFLSSSYQPFKFYQIAGHFSVFPIFPIIMYRFHAAFDLSSKPQWIIQYLVHCRKLGIEALKSSHK